MLFPAFLPAVEIAHRTPRLYYLAPRLQLRSPKAIPDMIRYYFLYHQYGAGASSGSESWDILLVMARAMKRFFGRHAPRLGGLDGAGETEIAVRGENGSVEEIDHGPGRPGATQICRTLRGLGASRSQSAAM